MDLTSFSVALLLTSLPEMVYTAPSAETVLRAFWIPVQSSYLPLISIARSYSAPSSSTTSPYFR